MTGIKLVHQKILGYPKKEKTIRFISEKLGIMEYKPGIILSIIDQYN